MSALLNLFLLERIEEPELHPGESSPWPEIMVDGCSSMVVAAGTEEGARTLAANAAQDEGPQVWLDPRFTAATLLGKGKGKKIGVAHVVIFGQTPS